MSLKFHAVERKVPSGPDKGKKLFYGQVRSEPPVSLDKVCEDISDHTSVTAADVLVVLEGFTKVISSELEKGNIVELGDLGNMRVTAGSKGAETEKGFKAWMMKKGRIIFSPGRLLRQVCCEVCIEKLVPKLVDEDCFFPHA